MTKPLRYSFREYMTHLFINTPIEEPAFFLARKIKKINRITKFNRQKHPELKHLGEERPQIRLAMQRLIQDQMNCLDVGTHFGQALSKILKLSPHGKHIAVEPVPYKAQWLRDKFPTVEVHQVAVSDAPGITNFYHYQQGSSGFSGINPLNSIKKKLGEQNEIQFSVKCERLDALIPTDRQIDFILMSIETNELNLRSAQQTLQRCQPHILFHCSRGGLMSTNSQPSEVFNFLTQHHYAVFLLRDWVNANQPLDVEQFSNAIMHYPPQGFEFLATPIK
jgi:FkbM family methyltransferase